MQNQLNVSESNDTMISIQNLTKGFERENLFENINLVLHPENKIAFVGKNGSGKTTFFNCLAGKTNFEGRIIVSDINISLMEQEQNFENLDKTFEEYLKGKKEDLEKRKKELEEKIGNPESFNSEDKFNSLMDEYNLLLTDSSFKMEEKDTRRILDELGMDETNLNQKIKSLSGGQKTKLRLAECLSKKADLYLLDEPTNNLDLETRQWLEAYINENIKNLVVISHDRYFMNQVVEKVWDLENKKIKEWDLGFSEYIEEKKKYIQVLARKYRDAVKRKKIMLESAEEKRRWASITGDKSKRITAERLERQAAELDEVEDPFKFIKEIKISFGSKALHNCEIFRIEGVTKKFDKVLFEDVNQEIDFGERVCVIGENGSGKSTFLKILIGKIKASKGEIYRRSNDVKIGYFDQELVDVDKEKTVMEFFLKETGKEKEKVIPILLKYGFEKESFNKKIKHLSGGEKGRLNILRISSEGSNVLVLDEPTNNLDVYLVESLEAALNEFKGTIVFVSHDRYFVDKIAKRIFEIKDKKVSSFKGNYSDYLYEKKKK